MSVTKETKLADLTIEQFVRLMDAPVLDYVEERNDLSLLLKTIEVDDDKKRWSLDEIKAEMERDAQSAKRGMAS